ncbi:MAG: ribonuclease HI family protein [Candidatus Moranbacteria bacterium]|nr:ribonuclease HI family protein [Candidatus Moranbacteria bacterium]MDD5652227.1 ribonuclease HI family protein [Candidatus Moranbacteria bacterium]MDX9855323.1 ribonuclease HI family protein [Candidatus Moranbacteria bacterium]
MADKIIMYTDGGSRGNPGPAGIGVWIETLDKKYGECIGKRTNNDAEYEALIFGLKKIKALLGKAKAKKYEVECFLDSELVVKQLKHEYKLKEERIQKYFIEIWNLMLDFKKVEFRHIPREKNIIADGLVNEALDNDGCQKSLL